MVKVARSHTSWKGSRARYLCSAIPQVLRLAFLPRLRFLIIYPPATRALGLGVPLAPTQVVNPQGATTYPCTPDLVIGHTSLVVREYPAAV